MADETNETQQFLEKIIEWFRNKQATITKMWADAIVASKLFHDIPSDDIHQMAAGWFSVAFKVFETNDYVPFTAFVQEIQKREDVREVALSGILECFSLLKKVEYGLLEEEFKAEELAHACRFVEDNLDAYRAAIVIRPLILSYRAGTRYSFCL